ncbi:hypothetical protein BDK51DRAFT_46760 [Blyttiomyces helicus]|uniref:Uncharacterized protein n=1 Tax=Blyttiomyces helicus TaxID=388810 RepID=A0A4P9WQ94_9FUNG|nr:hypothetical protein BDK51DRAFT_46760 [Blyttiomyces helicus]|eukprot:RKO94762.1 hypothetical protein BDK51DRAFT_46760 [Blyttiomyces helicus]
MTPSSSTSPQTSGHKDTPAYGSISKRVPPPPTPQKPALVRPTHRSPLTPSIATHADHHTPGPAPPISPTSGHQTTMQPVRTSARQCPALKIDYSIHQQIHLALDTHPLHVACPIPPNRSTPLSPPHPSTFGTPPPIYLDQPPCHSTTMCPAPFKVMMPEDEPHLTSVKEGNKTHHDEASSQLANQYAKGKPPLQCT